MSEARELYMRVCAESPFWKPGNPEVAKRFSEVAELWRRERRFFSASICMIQAVQAAWGTAELDGFITPGLRGWALAVDGFLTPGQQEKLFAAAAEAFSRG